MIVREVVVQEAALRRYIKVHILHNNNNNNDVSTRCGVVSRARDILLLINGKLLDMYHMSVIMFLIIAIVAKKDMIPA